MTKKFTLIIDLGTEERTVTWSAASADDAEQLALSALADADKARVCDVRLANAHLSASALAVASNLVREKYLASAKYEAYKWAYLRLQDRMRSIDRHGWAEDCDGEIADRIHQARGAA